MKPRFLPILLAFCPLVLNQCAAVAYDDNAQLQIQQIQNQLQQQFPQQIQSNQPFRPSGMPTQQFNQSMAPDAQQQILQINQQLQQMTQGQQFQQQPPQLSRPAIQQMQPMQQVQQVVQTQMMQAQSPQQNQNSSFAPSNSQSLNLPVLNSTVSGYASVSDVVPNPVGVTSGVDILDESLKFHSQGNGQLASRPNLPMNNQNPNLGVSLQNSCSHATAAGASAQGCCQHAHGNATANSASNAGGTGLNTPLNTRAIGAIGAAALVGTFLGNGGVGGMIKSVGWDNSRHTRGMSIGGY